MDKQTHLQNIEAVRTINDYLSTLSPQQIATNTSLLNELAIQCASWKAFTGEVMSAQKKEWMDAKRKAYETFIASSEANQRRVEKYGVMMVKDYISARCGEYESTYELLERTNNACGYMEDALRSVIASLREEMKSINYAPRM